MTNCEDLATKAELQELRDQLNELLGTREDGTTETLFEKDAGTTLIVGGAGLTLLGLAKNAAPNVITDIVLEAPGTQSIWKELSNGSAKLLGFKGNGRELPITSLNKVGKVAADGVSAGRLNAGATANAGASLNLLANLTNLAGTLALNIATVKVLDNRIEAESKGAQLQIDTLNRSMFRLLDKQQGDIDAVVADLDANQQVVRNNRAAIDATRFEVSNVNRINSEQSQKIQEFSVAIQNLRSQNAYLVEQINSSQLETQDIISGLRAHVATVEENLTKAESIIGEQQSIIAAITQQVDNLEITIEDLENRIQATETQYTQLREELELLKQELSGEIDITNDRVTTLEGRIAKTQKFVKQTSRTGGGQASRDAVRTTQDGVIKLTSKLAGTEYQPIGSNSETSFDYTTEFNRTLEDLLTQTQTGGGVTPEQIEELQTGILTGVDTNLNTLLGSLVVPRLNDLTNQTTDERQRANVRSGICDSLNGQGGCPGTPGNSNPTQGLNGMQNLLNGNMDRISALLGLGNLGANQTILSVVRNTNSVVNSTTHGLQAIQNFASTAWRVTKADKIMNAVTMAVTIHNGMMLSNNLAATVSEAINMSLNALNIRDETDTPIDIGEAVREKMASILTSVLGAEQYAALTTRIASANRIYQSSVNMLHAINDLHDSARSVAEMTAEHTGKIGNALREAGAVYEDAYEEFSEKINPQSKAMRNLEKFRGTIEGVSEPIETITQMSSEIIEIQENFTQLTEAKNEWKDEINSVISIQQEEKDTVKIQNQVQTDINANDFNRDTAEN